jgi:hypothetical protein
LSEKVPGSAFLYAEPVELEIIPEPTDGERAAIERAVAGLLAASERGTSAWWRARVDGDLFADLEDPAPRDV